MALGLLSWFREQVGSTAAPGGGGLSGDRSARDDERKPAHAEAMIKVAMIRLMAARLAGENIEPQGPIGTEAARRLNDELHQQ